MPDTRSPFVKKIRVTRLESMCYLPLRWDSGVESVVMEQPANQTDLNYDAFVAQLPNLIRDHAGTYALLHNGKVIDFFPGSLEATLEGAKRFGRGAYSVQEVASEPDHLGFYSYVGGSGQY